VDSEPSNQRPGRNETYRVGGSWERKRGAGPGGGEGGGGGGGMWRPAASVASEIQ
jgi:hypothetical protein